MQAGSPASGLHSLHGWPEIPSVVLSGLKHHLTARKLKQKASNPMTTLRNSFAQGFFGRAFAVLSAANAAAAAVEGHRRPKERDLKTLGINPADFPRV
jgi:hypothetical protein